jgi:hypothetical protein
MKIALHTMMLLKYPKISIADPGRISRILDPNFSIPDPGSKKILDPGSGSTSKNLSIFNLKKLFLGSRKYDPDPDLDVLPIPDPGVKKTPDPGSATLRKIRVQPG